MKSSVQTAIERALAAERCAFIPFLTGGFPDPDTCVHLLQALADNGADVIEVGVPFSDPLADGPTIQTASRKALDRGVTPAVVFDVVARTAKQVSCPIVLMTYFNPVLRMGLQDFARKAKESGCAGVIIPDLPVEEAAEWVDVSRGCELDTIFLVAPTTPPERMQWIASLSRGFLYYVSTTGVTGSACAISDRMVAQINLAKSLSPVPVAVGFGIAAPDQARALAPVVDGIIVGSAFIRQIQAHETAQDQVAAVSRLAASLSGALGRARSDNGNETAHVPQ
jgi:tryptophan synthase alpha chain